jgi:two-component SAPR family response regulator
MKILIAESNIVRIKTFIEILGNHNLTIVDKVEEAVDHLENEVFDMIFLGNKLNDGYGADIAARLGGDPENINNESFIIAHTWDESAVEAIKTKLPYSEISPFGPDLFEYLGLTNYKE